MLHEKIRVCARPITNCRSGTNFCILETELYLLLRDPATGDTKRRDECMNSII